MKTYKSKTSAVRAAAKALGVARTIKAVTEVANLEQTADGWQWMEIAKEPVKTVTAQVRAIADNIGQDRAAVMAECRKRGFNMTSASTMYANWRNQQLAKKSG